MLENENFIQLHVDFLENLDLKKSNVYIIKDGNPKLIKKKGVPFRKDIKEILHKFKTEEKNKVLIEKADVWKLFENLRLDIPKLSKNSKDNKEIIDKIFSLTETMYEALMLEPKKENFKIASETSNAIVKFIEYNPSVVKLTVSTLKKDINTVIHTRNVQLLVSGFSYFLGMNGLKLKTLVNGALFHDIGKIKIKDEILKKPGKLSADEFDFMKKHTVYGYEILKKNNLGQYSVMALSHHEFIDGTGYPNGAVGKEIPIHARIIQVCDIFEALTGLRPYRTPMETFDALELMKKRFVDIGKIEEKLFEKFLQFLNINEK